MILLDLLACFLVIFSIYYVFFQFYLIIHSSRGRIKDIERRNYTVKFQQNLTIVIYSHNNASTIIELIDSLKKQDYDPEKYSINVILDNCSDNSAKLLEIIGGTRLWRINTDIKPIGKNKSYAWLLERILASENTNAFVFLTGDCKVKPDFLSRINTNILDTPVIIGEIIKINQQANLITNLEILQNKLSYRINKYGRYNAGLGNILDTDVFAIRQDILEKVNFPIIDYGFEEHEYSIKLKQSKIQVSCSNNVFAYKYSYENFKTIIYKEYERRFKNLTTFKNNFIKLITNSSLGTKELILSLIYPSAISFTILMVILLYLSSNTSTIFAQLISPKSLLYLYITFFTSKLFKLLAARCDFNDFKNAVVFAVSSPIFYIFSIIWGLHLPEFKINISLPKLPAINNSYSRKTVTTTLTDGDRELPCQLEIRQGDQGCQAIFIYNNKKMASNKYQQINDALDEIFQKLKAHGFALKICLNCGYFDLNDSINAQFKGEQGYCIYNNVHNSAKYQECTYIWDSCKKIIPAQAKKAIQNKLSENLQK